MLYPATIEDKIGFRSVREEIASECLSDMGLRKIEALRFSTDFEEVLDAVTLTEEFKRVLEIERAFPSQDYFDLRENLAPLRVIGNFPDVEFMIKLRASLHTAIQILVFIHELDEEKYPTIGCLIENVYIPEIIVAELKRLLNVHDEIDDHASPELFEIRQKIKRKQREADKRIQHFIQLAKKEGWSDDEAEPTIRNERLVIPVIAGNKRKIQGFVHDVSSTGQTIFIEPEEVFGLNNELKELENDERLEIIRILKAFADELRPYIDDLFGVYEMIGNVDFVRAKAKFAIRIRANKPLLNAVPAFEWFDAIHPLLFLSHQKQHKTVVPLSVSLNEEQRILIISGPNAGGKSVCLKTVGLLQYMLQCGLLIPIRETSECGFFNNLFIDIGDQQSIENDLSTYSSHLTAMKNFLAYADENTLFLADELGGGTEPQLGGAIAETILEELNLRHAKGVITTHYTNLKLMADKHSGFKNGAMLFDVENLQPLYMLQVGKPGSSFAFEMAQNIGFDKSIIEKATQKVGQNYFEFEQQLQQLEIDKKHISQAKTELALADDLLSETIKKYQKLSDKIESDKKQILEKAKLEAKEIVKKSNQLIEKTIREIKEHNAEQQITQKLRNELELHVSEMEKRENKVTSERKSAAGSTSLNPQSSTLIAVGDWVRIEGGDAKVQVVEIRKNKAVVSSGILKMDVPLASLVRLENQNLSETKRSGRFGSFINELNDRKAKFTTTLDLRGERAEEALELTQKFLDDALLFGEKQVRILHGKGNGILRQQIRAFLEHNKDIQSFGDERLEQGGAGITVIYLK